MKTVNEIKKVLAEHKEELKQKYNVKEIGIFGSYVRGEQTKNSDLDILVKFRKPIGLDFVELADYLEAVLKTKVDLVSSGAIKPSRRKYIMQDLVHV